MYLRLSSVNEHRAPSSATGAEPNARAPLRPCGPVAKGLQGRTPRAATTKGNAMIARRILLTGAAAGAGLLACPAVLRAQAPKVLKISHQFPGGTLEQGDFRDRLCRRFAAEVEKRTGGAVRADVYANSSLM